MRSRCSMDKKKIINDIKQEYLIKRIRAEEASEQYISRLKEDKYFDNIYTDYNIKKLEYMKSKYEIENLNLKKEVLELQKKIDAYLESKHLDKSALSPKYECEICRDTGVVAGKICSCVIKELHKRLTNSINSQKNFHSFDNCDVKIMNEQDKKATKILKTWCDTYPNISKININIVGGAGSGKTFLLECIANEVIEKGCFVCFKTMFELNELARLYHIGKSYELTDCMKAGVLLIDDLGTEPILNNVTKEYLYNIINTRQVNKLPTIISTNLSPDDILNRYDERIFSRLTNKNLCINIQLDSQDKRFIEKKS